MKIRPGKNEVAIILRPREAVAFGQQLIKAAIASRAPVEEPDEGAATEQPSEEPGNP